VLPADCAVEDEIRPAIDQAAAAWGGLDIIIANAAIELPAEDNRVDKVSLEAWEQTDHKDPDLVKYWSEPITAKRPGTADEVASAILWLASEEASYCIGSALRGGWGTVSRVGNPL
jgi:NAD(P)-dependent dehydrogenase (short-subunit alcohol dehydrogenase family)